jgi:hypothetical protein
VKPEGLGQLKECNYLIGNRTHNIPARSIPVTVVEYQWRMSRFSQHLDRRLSINMATDRLDGIRKEAIVQCICLKRLSECSAGWLGRQLNLQQDTSGTLAWPPTQATWLPSVTPSKNLHVTLRYCRFLPTDFHFTFMRQHVTERNAAKSLTASRGWASAQRSIAHNCISYVLQCCLPMSVLSIIAQENNPTSYRLTLGLLSGNGPFKATYSSHRLAQSHMPPLRSFYSRMRKGFSAPRAICQAHAGSWLPRVLPSAVRTWLCKTVVQPRSRSNSNSWKRNVRNSGQGKAQHGKHRRLQLGGSKGTTL